MAEKVEVKNTQRLIDDCHKTVDGVKVPKTKTAHILDTLTKDSYQRKPLVEITRCSKHVAKTLIIARFGMLDCGRNFKGSMKETCSTCCTKDDEEHRMNFCPKYCPINNYGRTDKVSFSDVHSNDATTLKNVVARIEQVWNTKTAHGSIRNH